MAISSASVGGGRPGQGINPNQGLTAMLQGALESGRRYEERRGEQREVLRQQAENAIQQYGGLNAAMAAEPQLMQQYALEFNIPLDEAMFRERESGGFREWMRRAGAQPFQAGQDVQSRINQVGPSLSNQESYRLAQAFGGAQRQQQQPPPPPPEDVRYVEEQRGPSEPEQTAPTPQRETPPREQLGATTYNFQDMPYFATGSGATGSFAPPSQGAPAGGSRQAQARFDEATTPRAGMEYARSRGSYAQTQVPQREAPIGGVGTQSEPTETGTNRVGLGRRDMTMTLGTEREREAESPLRKSQAIANTMYQSILNDPPQELDQYRQEDGTYDGSGEFWGTLDSIIRERYAPGARVGSGEVTPDNLIRNAVGDKLVSGGEGGVQFDENTTFKTGEKTLSAEEFLRPLQEGVEGEVKPEQVAEATRAAEQTEYSPQNRRVISVFLSEGAAPAERRAAGARINAELQQRERSLPEDARTVWKGDNPENFADRKMAEFLNMREQAPEMFDMMFPQVAQAEAAVDQVRAQTDNQRAIAALNRTKSREAAVDLDNKLRMQNAIGKDQLIQHYVDRFKSEMQMDQAKAEMMAAQAALYTMKAEELKYMMENPEEASNAETIKMLRDLATQALKNPEGMNEETLQLVVPFLNTAAQLEGSGLQFGTERVGGVNLPFFGQVGGRSQLTVNPMANVTGGIEAAGGALSSGLGGEMTTQEAIQVLRAIQGTR